MTVTSATYRFKSKLFAGLGVFSNPNIAYVDLIAVKVEGTEYDIIYEGTPTSRQARYDETLGALFFVAPINPNAKVFVIYQR